LILAQKGNLRKLNDALADPDFAKAVLALRLAVMLMHGRIGVDQSQLRLRMKTKARIDIELRRDLIAQHPTLAYWLEKEREWWDAIGTELAIRQTG
jgi:exopolyphosphatase/guanosine-5'-triphosphate,3'-diphosphate pyrophosphatase